MSKNKWIFAIHEYIHFENCITDKNSNNVKGCDETIYLKNIVLTKIII